MVIRLLLVHLMIIGQKFGKDIYCCGHSEANCIHKLMSSSFRVKRKPSLVLASLSGKPTK